MLPAVLGCGSFIGDCSVIWDLLALVVAEHWVCRQWHTPQGLMCLHLRRSRA